MQAAVRQSMGRPILRRVVREESMTERGVWYKDSTAPPLRCLLFFFCSHMGMNLFFFYFFRFDLFVAVR